MKLYLRASILVAFLFSAVPVVLAQQAQRNAAVVNEERGTPRVWDVMSNAQKITAIKKAIDQLKRKGVIINKDPGFYAQQVDAIFADHADLTDDDVGSVLRALAITYRDFDNGRDPEEMIKSEFGVERYNASLYDARGFREIYKAYLRRKEERKSSSIVGADRKVLPGTANTTQN